MAAGAVLAVLGMATFAWLDNAFFAVISQQQETIDNFRDSGMTSMHAYLNSGLESATPGVTIFWPSSAPSSPPSARPSTQPPPKPGPSTPPAPPAPPLRAGAWGSTPR